MIPSPDIKELNLKDYFEIVKKNKWIVIAFVVVITSLVAIFSFSSPKTYRTKAKLILKEEIPQITGAENLIYKGSRRESSSANEDQLSLLESKTVAEKVIKKLNLLTNEKFGESKDPTGKLLAMIDSYLLKPEKKSNVVEIAVTGRDPLLITRIANTWLEAFMEVDVEHRATAAKQGIAWLQNQLEDTLKKLETAERELNDFVKRYRIVTIPDVGKQKETLIEEMKSVRARLGKEVIEASKKYGEKHPKMIELQTQLEATEQKLQEEKDTLFALQERSLEYNVLRRAVDGYKESYDVILKRISELEISKDLVVTNIQPIDEATLPTRPIKPQPTKDILRALLASFILGIGVIFFREYLDSTLKTSEDVEFYAKMPFLGSIASARREAKEEDIDLIVFKKPRSQVAETFRNLRVSLTFSSPEEKPLNVMAITSSIAKEGKSFISTNLATVFANTKEETLLVGADMRKPRLEKIFNIDNKNGLSSLLAGVCRLDEAIISTSIPYLSFLAAGPIAPNPSELLTSNKLGEIIKELRQRFKKVIIDAPPVLGISDTLLLGGKCDGLVFVIRGRSTPLKLITESKRILNGKVKIIGAVLNNVEIEKDRDYSYQYYYSSDKDD